MNALATAHASGRSWIRDLGRISWIYLIVLGALGLTLGRINGGSPNEIGLTLGMIGFFGLIFARLIFAMVRWPERRVALGSLTAGVAFWAAGSMAINGAGSAA